MAHRDEQPQKQVMQNYETICSSDDAPIASPIDENGVVYVVSASGEISSVVDNQLEVWFSTGGFPSGLVFDPQGNIFIADFTHKAILSQTEIEGRVEVTPILKEYEGNDLLGPNSLVLGQVSNKLYFTDSGPLGTSTIAKPLGSVFVIDLEVSVLKPLALNCLAHPSGLAISEDEDCIYVCETYKNRVLRFFQTSPGVYNISTFCQFSGRLGPNAITISEQGLIYVSRFDFHGCSRDGLITVLNRKGDIIDDLIMPDIPEITGLTFSKKSPNELIITEASGKTCIKLTVPTEELQMLPDHSNLRFDCV